MNDGLDGSLAASGPWRSVFMGPIAGLAGIGRSLPPGAPPAARRAAWNYLPSVSFRYLA
jgi:hypothetical protein